MGRFWSLLFLCVPVFGVAIFVVAAMPDSWPLYNHWLPKDISEHGHVIDSLFYFILYLTGVIFIATSLVLFWYMWKYDGERQSEPVEFTHGNHTLEVVWSILPAATLLFIAVFQMDSWAQAKMRRPVLSLGPDQKEGTADDVLKPPLLRVTARQFEWRLRYAGEDGIIGTQDDVHLVNDLHVPVNEEIVLELESMDVLHSFFLPNVRVKQDAVPGMKQYVWFKCTETGTFDIVCAELCGWGHYKMRGRLTVETQEEFDQWLKQQFRDQEVTEFKQSEE